MPSRMRVTFSTVSKRSNTLTASPGAPASRATRSSLYFWPPTEIPPFALISSIAMRRALWICTPYGAMPPVRPASSPMRSVCWAQPAAGTRAEARNATSARTRTVLVDIRPPCCWMTRSRRRPVCGRQHIIGHDQGNSREDPEPRHRIENHQRQHRYLAHHGHARPPVDDECPQMRDVERGHVREHEGRDLSMPHDGDGRAEDRQGAGRQQGPAEPERGRREPEEQLQVFGDVRQDGGEVKDGHHRQERCGEPARHVAGPPVTTPHPRHP